MHAAPAKLLRFTNPPLLRLSFLQELPPPPLLTLSLHDALPIFRVQALVALCFTRRVVVDHAIDHLPVPVVARRDLPQIGRAHVCTPVTLSSRMPSSASKQTPNQSTPPERQRDVALQLACVPGSY